MKTRVFLGDSLTWGGYGGNFLLPLAGLMPNERLVNAGVGGNTVINLLLRLDDILAMTPDGVFIMIGGNDAISYLYPQTRPYYRSAQGIENGFVAPDEFVRAYRDLLTRLQLAYVETWVALPPTEYSADLALTLSEYNQLAREAAHALNVPVLDLAAHFTPAELSTRPPMTLKTIQQIGTRERENWADYEAEQRRLGYTYTFDGMHLTLQAAQQFAEQIAAFFNKL